MARWIFLICLVCGLAPSAGAGTDKEPAYGGKPLSRWMKSLKDKNYAVRTQAANALGQIGPAGGVAVAALIDALDDASSGVPQWKDGGVSFTIESPQAKQFREAVLDALHRIGEPTLPPLVAGLKDNRQLVRVGVAEALEKFEPVPSQVTPEVLLPALKDENELVRQSAVRMLVRLGDIAVAPLGAALQQGGEAREKVAAANALGQMGAKARPAIPALTSALKDADSGVRREAADTLQTVSPAPEAVAPLRELLSDKDEEVRLAAAAALARNGVADAVPALVSALQQDSKEGEDFLKGAADSAGRVSTPRPTAAERAATQSFSATLGVLARAVERKSAEKRVKAARALGYLGPAAKSGVPALKQALQDRDEGVRVAAKEALAKIE